MEIGAVARLSGTPASAIRYYEASGLLAKAVRVNGRRRFDSTVLRELQLIRLGRSLGFTVAQMRQLRGQGQESAWQPLLARKRAEAKAALLKAEQLIALLERAEACGCKGPIGCSMSLDLLK